MAEEEIDYWNNRDKWPDKDLWDKLCEKHNTDTPPDAHRCQQEDVGPVSERWCGLPRYRDVDGAPRCFFHYTGENREGEKLQENLEAAVESGAGLWDANLGEANLLGADLSGANLWDANLNEANLSQADLSGASLQGAYLSEAAFGDADLKGAYLSKANLSGTFLRDANLSETNLGRTDLSEAVLEGANLSEAVLGGANLSRAVLKDADLSEADLGDSDLTEAVVWGADLSGTDLRGADLSEAVLWEADLSGADLRDATLADARLMGCEISPDTKLNGVEWSEDCILPDEDTPSRAFGQCAAVYRQIKQSYQHSGQYQQAGNFFIREKECQRFTMAAEGPPTEEGRSWYQWARDWVSHYISRGWQCLIYYLCGHGERPAWLVKWMVLLIGIFAWGQGMLGISNSNGNLLVQGLGPPAFEPFRKALYFSTVTFTSLGYGDMRPVGAIGQTLAGVEAALGLVLMSLLLVCIVRKFSR